LFCYITMSRQRTYRVGETISRPANPAPNFVIARAVRPWQSFHEKILALSAQNDRRNVCHCEGAQAPVAIFPKDSSLTLRMTGEMSVTREGAQAPVAIFSKDSPLTLRMTIMHTFKITKNNTRCVHSQRVFSHITVSRCGRWRRRGGASAHSPMRFRRPQASRWWDGCAGDAG